MLNACPNNFGSRDRIGRLQCGWSVIKTHCYPCRPNQDRGSASWWQAQAIDQPAWCLQIGWHTLEARACETCFYVSPASKVSTGAQDAADQTNEPRWSRLFRACGLGQTRRSTAGRHESIWEVISFPMGGDLLDGLAPKYGTVRLSDWRRQSSGN